MIKYSIFIILCTLFAILISACSASSKASQAGSAGSTTSAAAASAHTSSSSAAPAYQKISQEAAKTRMDSGDPIIILDVRTAEEFSGGHIPGALNLALDQIGRDAASVLPDKDAEILVYCRSGNRSKSAAKELLRLGYTRIYDFGGIMSWTYGTE